MPPVKLITKAEWEKLTPTQQGYCLYFQGNLPGSELRDLVNPYAIGSKERKAFAVGEFTAMLDAQDSEE